MEQNITKQEMSMQELITLINDRDGDFLVSIDLGEETDTVAKEERIQD